MKRLWMLLVIGAAGITMGFAVEPSLQLRSFHLGKKEIGLYQPMRRAGCKKLQLDAVMKLNNFTIDSLHRMHVGDLILIPQGCEAVPSAEVARLSMADLAAEKARSAKLHAAVSTVKQPIQDRTVIPRVAEKSPQPQSVPTPKASVSTVADTSSFWPKPLTMIICFVLGAVAIAIFEVCVPILSKKKFEAHLSEIRRHGLEYQRSHSLRCIGKNGCGNWFSGDQIDTHHLKSFHSGLRMKVMPTEIIEPVTSSS